MKKNIIIVLLTIVALVSLAYGYVQKVKAEQQTAITLEMLEMAMEARREADEMRAEAERQRQRQIAEVNAIRAMGQAELALEALNEAKK